MPVNFKCDITSKSKPFIHFWEKIIGSGHATLGLRADWQEQLLKCKTDLGFKYVRFHGLLSDDMGSLLYEENKLRYSFFNIDEVYDYIISIGMFPFVELSFMPTAIASGPDTVFKYKGNITPPKNYKAWNTLIEKLATHWIERYGINCVKNWFFEVWNEPNLQAFWTGTKEDYFKFYGETARTLKKVNNILKVGGPATAANAWITDFKNYCTKNKLPLDFISTHHYPTDAFGKPGDDTAEQLAKSCRSMLQKETKKANEEAGDLPLYYTEWNTSSNPFDKLHDESFAAAFITKIIMENQGLVKGYSYWTFTDIFEENYLSSIPFHGGFGLMNINGIPKPAYRAYELLHKTGNRILPVEGKHKTVDVWVTRNNNSLFITLTNFALPKHRIKQEEVLIKLDGLLNIKSAILEQVDEENSNAPNAWKKIGKPESLLPKQVVQLQKISMLKRKQIHYQKLHNEYIFQLKINPQSVAMITVKL